MTPEQEAKLRAMIDPEYVTTEGTESWERALFFAEIDQLRSEADRYEQQAIDARTAANFSRNELEVFREKIKMPEEKNTFEPIFSHECNEIATLRSKLDEANKLGEELEAERLNNYLLHIDDAEDGLMESN